MITERAVTTFWRCGAVAGWACTLGTAAGWRPGSHWQCPPMSRSRGRVLLPPPGGECSIADPPAGRVAVQAAMAAALQAAQPPPRQQ